MSVETLVARATTCTHLWRIIARSDEYRKWKSLVKRKFQYKCADCGISKSRYHRLNCHHIKPKVKFIGSMFNSNNGKLLCTTCHIEEHKRMRATGKDYKDKPSAGFSDIKDIIKGLTFKVWNRPKKRKKSIRKKNVDRQHLI